jgi:hypothetical protein
MIPPEYTPDDLPSTREELQNLDEEELNEAFEKLFDDPLAREILKRTQKRHWIENDLMAEASFKEKFGFVYDLSTVSHVTEGEIDDFLDTQQGQEIYEQVKADFDNEEVSEGLKEQYRQNAEPVIEEAERYIERLRKQIYGRQYEEVKQLEDSDRDDKDETLDCIRENRKTREYEEYWDEISSIQRIISSLSRFPYSQQKVEKGTVTINEDPRHLQKHYALEIDQPKLFTGLYTHEPEFQDFPYKWLSNLPMYLHRLLYETYKHGDLLERFVVDEIEENDSYLDELREVAEILPPFREREQIVDEIIANYEDERYASAINLVLPQIEHLLWHYAAYMDTYREQIFIDADYQHHWDFNLRDQDNLKLLNSNGEEMKPLIRDLVEYTALADELNPSVVEHFVEELFEERNPILHGNVSDYHSQIEAAKKIIFFKIHLEELKEAVVTDTVNRLMENGLFDQEGEEPVESEE